MPRPEISRTDRKCPFSSVCTTPDGAVIEVKGSAALGVTVRACVARRGQCTVLVWGLSGVEDKTGGGLQRWAELGFILETGGRFFLRPL